MRSPRWMSLLAALPALTVWAAAGLSAPPEVKTVRFVAAPGTASAIVLVARDQGHFEREGIELKALNDMAAGLVVDNILGGHAEMVYGGITTMLMPYTKGAPLVSIASTDHNTAYELIVHKDSPYRKIEDLKGKTIAVIAPNTLCVLAMRRIFEQNGWAKDFAKFTAVAPNDQVAAFGAKRVDASCMFDPYRMQMMRQFGGRSIWNSADGQIANGISGTLIMGRAFVEKNPNTVAAIQRAVGKAAVDANADPDLIYRALATAIRQDISAVRGMAMPTFSNPPSRPDDVKQIAELLHRYGFVNAPIDVSGFDRSSPAAGRK
jgi:NitT/TauT family transport system substrate-binding protein